MREKSMNKITSKKKTASKEKEMPSKHKVSKESAKKSPLQVKKKFSKKTKSSMSKESLPERKDMPQSSSAPPSSSAPQSGDEPTPQGKKTTPQQKSKFVVPRRINSFGYGKPVKTSNQIKEELQGQRSTCYAKDVLVGTNGRKYNIKGEIHCGKKGSIIQVVDGRPEFAHEQRPEFAHQQLVAKTQNLLKGKEGIHNEIRFLLEFQQTLRDCWHGSDHFLPICSYGGTAAMSWYVQPLCGSNLNDLRKEMGEEFSPSTAIRLGLMLLDAVNCLHRCGVIHGRLEPQHVVIGSGTLRSNIYLVGLGHISQVGVGNSLPSTFTWSRQAAYAPRRAGRDPYATELETWFYVLLDLYGRQHLPWKKESTIEKVQRFKEQIYMFPLLMPSHFPSLFKDLIYTLNKGDEFEGNMARVLRRRLTDYMKQQKISRHRPFEWELEKCQQKEKVDHAERMKQHNLLAAQVKAAAEQALLGYVGAEDDD